MLRWSHVLQHVYRETFTCSSTNCSIASGCQLHHNTYTASNGKMTDEMWIVEDPWRKRQWSNRHTLATPLSLSSSSNMLFCHLLTRSGLTRLQVSLMVSPGSFCLLVYSFTILGNPLRGNLFICCNQFLLYSCILPKTVVTCSSFAISMFVLHSVQVYPRGARWPSG